MPAPAAANASQSVAPQAGAGRGRKSSASLSRRWGSAARRRATANRPASPAPQHRHQVHHRQFRGQRDLVRPRHLDPGPLQRQDQRRGDEAAPTRPGSGCRPRPAAASSRPRRAPALRRASGATRRQAAGRVAAAGSAAPSGRLRRARRAAARPRRHSSAARGRCGRGAPGWKAKCSVGSSTPEVALPSKMRSTRRRISGEERNEWRSCRSCSGRSAPAIRSVNCACIRSNSAGSAPWKE